MMIQISEEKSRDILYYSCEESCFVTAAFKRLQKWLKLIKGMLYFYKSWTPAMYLELCWSTCDSMHKIMNIMVFNVTNGPLAEQNSLIWVLNFLFFCSQCWNSNPVCCSRQHPSTVLLNLLSHRGWINHRWHGRKDSENAPDINCRSVIIVIVNHLFKVGSWR